jgi:hypothetical protein
MASLVRQALALFLDNARKAHGQYRLDSLANDDCDFLQGRSCIFRHLSSGLNGLNPSDLATGEFYPSSSSMLSPFTAVSK